MHFSYIFRLIMIGVSSFFASVTVAQEILSSWHDTAAKQRIVDFVAAVSDSHHDNFVPAGERIAAFDNDGTLWVEKPLAQVVFTLMALQAEAEANPALLDTQPYKAAYTNDMDYFQRLDQSELAEVFLLPFKGLTQEAYTEQVRDFLSQAKHPRYDRRYTELVYQPMLELIDYLQQHDFTVYIVTGGGSGFVRAYVSDVFVGLKPSNVVATAVTVTTVERDGAIVLLRSGDLREPVNLNAGKVQNFYYQVGQRPLMSVGNSDGDIELLMYAADANRPSLSIVLHHDDAAREYAYDTGAEKLLKHAEQAGWLVVSMKNDFAELFSQSAEPDLDQIH